MHVLSDPSAYTLRDEPKPFKLEYLRAHAVRCFSLICQSTDTFGLYKVSPSTGEHSSSYSYRLSIRDTYGGGLGTSVGQVSRFFNLPAAVMLHMELPPELGPQDLDYDDKSTAVFYFLSFSLRVCIPRY